MSTATPSALRVFLIRHAHAAWAMPGMRDFDRPLDQGGREEAEQLAANMAVNAFAPDIIYCSTARRCRETLDIILSRLSISPKIEVSDTLYSASNETYFNLVKSHQDKNADSIMIVGHNPMLEDLALNLIERDPAVNPDVLGLGFPTAGLFIADCSFPPAQPEPSHDKSIDGDQNTDLAVKVIALLSPIDA